MRFREWRGMVDMGRFGWPRPRAVVFSDRTTDTEYLLSHSSSSDTITLVTPVPRRIYARPEEPVLNSPVGNIRLFVSNGVLSNELVEYEGSVRMDEPVFTLNISDRRTTYQIHASGVTVFGDPLCLIKYSNLGRTTLITDLGCNLDLAEIEVDVFEEGVFEEGVFD